MCGETDEEKSWESLSKSFSIYSPFTFPFLKWFLINGSGLSEKHFPDFLSQNGICLKFSGFPLSERTCNSHIHMLLTQVYFASCFFEYKEMTTVGHGAVAITLGIFTLALLTLNNQYWFLQEGSHHLQEVWRIRVPCSPLPEITTKVPLCTEHSPVIQANPGTAPWTSQQHNFH